MEFIQGVHIGARQEKCFVQSLNKVCYDYDL